MSLAKEKQYQNEFRSELQLIKGLNRFLRQTHDAGIKMAIGSAAIMFNIDFVLDGLQIRKYFDAIVSADDVNHSKPDPETYIKCAKKLKIDDKDCLVFEDAPKGVEAAQNAGMDCVVVNSLHQEEEFEKYKNVILIAENFEKVELEIERA